MTEDIVFGANEEYVELTKKYGRMDALLAVGLYIVLLIITFFMGSLFATKGVRLTQSYAFCARFLYAIVCIGIVFVLCNIKKQKLTTIGFSKNQAKKSFVVGLVLSILIIIYKGFLLLISGKQTNTNISMIVMEVISNLIFVGFLEELIFRGYIGTRLFGYFKNKVLSIIVVGIMFAFLHIPYRFVMLNMTFYDFMSVYWMSFPGLVIPHLFLQWLYSKYNSIIAPTMVHFIWDFL